MLFKDVLGLRIGGTFVWGELQWKRRRVDVSVLKSLEMLSNFRRKSKRL